MYWLPKKLETKDINFLYKTIMRITEGSFSEKFLQYFYDADSNIDSFDKKELELIKKLALNWHFNYFHFEKILNLKSYQKYPVSKKFLNLKNKISSDEYFYFIESLWSDTAKQSCLHKKIKLNSGNSNVIRTFTPQILKNIHSLICKNDLSDLKLIFDIENISQKYFPFQLMYFDTISLYTHLLSHLDLFKKHHKFLLKQADKIIDENDSMPSENLLDFKHDVRADFFDMILGFGDEDDQNIFNENYKKYKKELDDTINAIENFTKTCIVYSEFTKNNNPEDNEYEYKISISEQLDYVKKVDEVLFSKLNSLNSENIKDLINYDFSKLLNFKFLSKLLENNQDNVNELFFNEYM